MALELMPDGVTFKKLNKTQEKALERYYQRAHGKPLAETVGLPLLAGGVVITGAIGAIAYIFRDEIKTTYEEEKEKFFDWFFGGIASLPKKAVVATVDGIRNIFGTKTQEELIAELEGMSEAEILAEVRRRLGIREDK